MIKLADIKQLYPNDMVTQVGSKQMFIVHRDRPLLLSYRTIIGLKINHVWHITTEEFSQTTSKQTSQFINDWAAKRTVERVEPDRLAELLSSD